MIQYFSTNLKSEKVSFEDALFKGLAPDGGLYLPTEFPKFNNEFFNSDWDYPELASEIIFLLLKAKYLKIH